MAVDLPSVCPLDCPDTCSLTVTVEGERITRVRGSRSNPFTRGAICNKVTRYPELIHGADRLTVPLARTGPKGSGRFAEITWEEALERVHAGFSAAMRRHGPQSIVPLNYAGPHGMLAYGSMDRRFFHRLGASLVNRVALCGGVRTEAYTATFGAVPALAPLSLAQARLVICWGFNVTVSGLHLTPAMQQARRNGGRLVVVDPRRTKIAEQADLHLPILPGTDVLLAWALAAELERSGGLDQAFIAQHVQGAEEFLARARALPLREAAAQCGVPAEDIQLLARWYREAHPAAIACGNGLERNRNGGSGLRAIFALPALAGKFGVPGGGVMNGASFAFPKTTARLHGERFIPPGTRTLNIVDIGHMLNDPQLRPPIQGLFIYNHNPLIVHPDQNAMRRGLQREDLFTVVCELTRTDSVAYADVVLPAASDFEHGDVFPSYGQHYLQRSQAVIPPVGQALPNMEIFRRLAARFGFTEPEFTAADDALMDEALNAEDPRLQGIRPSQLPLERALPMQFAGGDPVLFQTTWPKTPSGKVELWSPDLEARCSQGLPRYAPLESRFPLYLVSPSSDQRITSTFGGLPASDETWVEMHPQDAAARHLQPGQLVCLWNDLGEVPLRLKVSGAVRPGVVCSPKGAWLRTSPNGQTVSALVPTHKADLSGGACFNDTRVEVVPWNGAPVARDQAPAPR
ncbi:MAG TPA: molybdopterin-dependent oxidoreductase [bacterium]|nr:molybdopterin-dependent oxidoreductase [bacterium]